MASMFQLQQAQERMNEIEVMLQTLPEGDPDRQNLNAELSSVFALICSITEKDTAGGGAPESGEDSMPPHAGVAAAGHPADPGFHGARAQSHSGGAVGLPPGDDQNPAPCRRRVAEQDLLPRELANAMRLHDVDRLDSALFDLYATPPNADDVDGTLNQYHRMYFSNFCNVIRDLLWVRDGPELPSTADAASVAKYIAWWGVTQVQKRHPEIEVDGERQKDFIDVATFHFVVTEPIWSDLMAHFVELYEANQWENEDITHLLHGADGESPLPSPREVLPQLRAVFRFGRLRDVPVALGQAEEFWDVLQSDRPTGQEAEEAAAAICSMKLFASRAGAVGGIPERDQLAELVMIVVGLCYGDFAIEFNTALMLADAMLAEIKRWNGGVQWMGDTMSSMADLLHAWDELVACSSVQERNPVKRFGPIPNPVKLLPQVVHSAGEAEKVDVWVFLDSVPVGSRVPLHMLRSSAKWKLHNHENDEQTGALYEWPPPVGVREYRYHPVQKQQAFWESPRGRAAAEAAHSPAADAPADDPAFVMRVSEETGQQRGGWGVIEDHVRGDGSRLVECGANGACFFNSVVFLLGHENSRFRVTLELASEGRAFELRCNVVERMRETLGEMEERFGPTVPYYGEGTTPWLDYLEMFRHPLAWVHGDWEINATADVICRVIDCVQYEDGLLMRLPIGVPVRADGGTKLLLARHADHYVAVEPFARGQDRDASRQGSW